jgi:signal transduction histidine kinase
MNSADLPATAVHNTFSSGTSPAPHEQKILVVAPAPHAHPLRDALQPAGYEIDVLDSIEMAFLRHEEIAPDLVLLDFALPGVHVFEFCRHLKNALGAAAPAVVFVGEQRDPREVVEGLAAGGVDFFSFPLQPADVRARVCVHLLNRRRLAALRREENAKNRLLCVAAHDLRNPLVSIRALTHLLRTGTAGGVNAQQRELLDTVYDASQSMLDLVNELLDVSIHEAGELKLTPRPSSLGQLVEACVRLNQANAAQKGSTIVLQAGALPPVMSLDEPKIRQVLNNMLGNAIKFSPPGSVITVLTESNADDCMVAVRDEGPGIRESDRARLFKDFSRSSAKPTGGESSTGLGLSICYKIVQAHAGAIEVSNLPQGGAEFRITLPIA